MYHRGDHATARDLFDLCLVIEREPAQLLSAAECLLRHRQKFIERIQARPVVLQASFAAIDTRQYAPSVDHCIETATDFLRSL